MNRFLTAGLVLATMTGGALAQAAAPAPAGPAPAGMAPPPAAAAPAPLGMRPPPAPDGMDAMNGGPGAPPPPPRAARAASVPPPPPPRAAHFRVQNGNLMLDVKCAEDEPTKVCADIALQMLDKLQAAPKT